MTVLLCPDKFKGSAVAYETRAPHLPSARAFTDRALELQLATDAGAVDAWRASYPEAGRAFAALTTDDGRTPAQRIAAARTASDLEAYNEANAARLDRADDRGVALGVERVLVAMPEVDVANVTGYNAEAAALSETHTRDQAKAIKAAMRATGVRGDVLAARLTKGSAADLNDIRVTREWTAQFLRYAPLRLVPHNHDRMVALADERDAERVVFLVDARTSTPGSLRGWVYGLLGHAVNPYETVMRMFSRQDDGARYSLVVDPRDLRVEFAQRRPYQARQAEVVERASLYALFRQIGQQPHRS